MNGALVPVKGLLRGEPLNPALDAAAAGWADPAGALLVVLGDVAGAASAELAALFEALDNLGGRGAVLAPARDGGSAALLRRPPHCNWLVEPLADIAIK